MESKLWETAAPALVQGNMDLLYKGTCAETYLKLVNSTAEDCASYYDENMTLQAQAFMNVFDVNDLDGTQTDRFADIMKQVYAQAEYTVGAVSQVDDTHFLVDVTVTPLDFPKQVNGALYTGLMTFVNAYGDVTDEQLNAMTDCGDHAVDSGYRFHYLPFPSKRIENCAASISRLRWKITLY